MTEFIAFLRFSSCLAPKRVCKTTRSVSSERQCATRGKVPRLVHRNHLAALASLLTKLVFLGLASLSLHAQVITTIAGGSIGDGASATSAVLNSPQSIAFDSSGNLYIAEYDNNRIRRVTAATGLISTVAGIGGDGGYNGDNIAATSAMLRNPISVAVDSSGNLYIADQGNNRVRKVTAATGLISTVAGTGLGGNFNGDGIFATSATLPSPNAVAVDASGNLYVSSSSRIRIVVLATGVISTLAGGAQDSLGENIPATSALLSPGTSGIALDTTGNIYIVDLGSRIRKVTASTGLINTVAGIVSSGSMQGIAFDATGDLYIAESGGNRVRKMTSVTGLISTVAGTAAQGYNGDNIAATDASLSNPTSVAFDVSGNLYIADRLNNRIRKVTMATGLISTVAGSASSTSSGDGGAALYAKLNNPQDMTIDSAGNLFVADQDNHRIRKIAVGTGVITTVVGSGAQGYNGDNIAATSATLNRPNGVAFDPVGNLYVLDNGNYRIRKVSAATGIITTVAGPAGVCDVVGSDTASCNPIGVALDSSGNLYFADMNTHRIRKVTIATGTVSTVAGTGQFGYNGDNIAATSATLRSPTGVAIDSTDNLYIADMANFAIRKVSAATGIITRVVGIGGPPLGLIDDNSPATSFTLTNIYTVKVDTAGNLFLTDGSRVRKVTAATGIITRVAGAGQMGAAGDGGPAVAATLNLPKGLAINAAGNTYISDTGNNRIRKVNAANYQGLWWKSPAGSESGWGLNIAQQSGVLFATWFTYDSTGKALWLSMSANGFGGDFIGTLYQSAGPAFSAMPFNPTAVTRTAVGTGKLTFTDAGNGSFSYILNGTTQTKAITRQVFGTPPTCIFSAQENLAAATNYQDIWWAAPAGVESGWGVNFTHQGDTLFATWFTYDADGTPLWLSATALKTGNGRYDGALFSTTGPAFNAVPFLSGVVRRNAVGTLSLAFANGNAGTFTYTLFGVTQSKPITRQGFSTPPTVCL